MSTSGVTACGKPSSTSCSLVLESSLSLLLIDSMNFQTHGLIYIFLMYNLDTQIMCEYMI